MSNETVKIVNAASEEGRRFKALKNKNQRKADRRRTAHNLVGVSVILANLTIKLAQLVFLGYIIFFDTDIVSMLSELTTEMAIDDSISLYLERGFLYVSVFLIAIISARGFIRLVKMLYYLHTTRKSGNKLTIATSFKYFFKDAVLEGFACILVLSLNSIMNYYNGMTLPEYAVSTFFTATFVFYIVAHSIRGVEILRSRRDIDNKLGKFRRYW